MAENKKLTVPEIIEYCKKDLGISFNLVSEDYASTFLQKNNYFFRLKLYAETWADSDKTKSGKYIGLDFGHLIELSTIDMFFRKLMFKMTVDLEHCLKVKIVNDCQNNPADDGYKVVEDFLNTKPKLKETLINSPRIAEYSGLFFGKYTEHPAVWNLVELISFHDFISFYSFYYDYFHLKCEYISHFESIRRIRNAAAHNVCILCSFKPVQNFKFDVETSMKLIGSNIGLNPTVLTNCMKVPLLNDFAVLLDTYTKLITSKKIKEKTLEELKEFFDGRMILHKDYFENCSDIKNAYKFARAVLELYIGDLYEEN